MSHEAKFKAIELFNEHLEMIATDQTLFRRTVMQALVNTCNITNAAAATHYNNAKKIAERSGIVTGLGRSGTASKRNNNALADNECYTISEVINGIVTRTQSFVSEESARAKLKERMSARVPTDWRLIRGLGPNVGDEYKLEIDEVELAH